MILLGLFELSRAAVRIRNATRLSGRFARVERGARVLSLGHPTGVAVASRKQC